MPSVKRRASNILNDYGAAQSELISKAVVLTDGKAGTVENVWLDELHGLRISIKDHDGRWPVSTIKIQGELDLRVGCALPRAPAIIQIIPIKMKRAISVRKATLMMATVRDTSAANRGFMSRLASCEARGVNHSGKKLFRFQTQTARDASGATASEAA